MTTLKKVARIVRLKSPYRERALREIVRFRLLRRSPSTRLITKPISQESLTRNVPIWVTAVPHFFSGIGHSATEWNAGRMIADSLGVDHVNVPLPPPWGQFLGWGAGSRLYWDLLEEVKPDIIRVPLAPWGDGIETTEIITSYIKNIAVTLKRPTLFILADGQNHWDHVSTVDRLRREFRTYGKGCETPLCEVSAPVASIALHVRRGDIVRMREKNDGNWRERLIGEEYFAGRLREAEHRIGNAAVSVHIYSQGAISDFPVLARRLNVQWHLDGDPRDAMMGMIRASLLIMSPSGFSYVAALLSQGRKMAFRPWWHKLASDWG